MLLMLRISGREVVVSSMQTVEVSNPNGVWGRSPQEKYIAERNTQYLAKCKSEMATYSIGNAGFSLPTLHMD